jgi:hypothetical protein
MQSYPLSPTTGPIPPEKIPGRNKEIEEIYNHTKVKSVVLTMIRRMGKTLLLQKFAYTTVKEARANKAIWFDLMRVDDITDLTDTLLIRLHQEQSWLKLNLERCKELYNKYRPTGEIKVPTGLPLLPEISFKLPEFKMEWKKALTACIEDLANRKTENDEIITLILDEFPYMLWNWILDGKVKDVIELLNLFRSIRMSLQEKNNIRFIICGSIGLDVVMNHLKTEHKYTAEPFNDMKPYVLEAMTDDDAHFLCSCLALSGFDFEEDKDTCIRKISYLTENLPFYINKIFEILNSSYNSQITLINVQGAFDELISNVNDDEVFEQLDTRIALYYPKQKDSMFTILDFLSKQQSQIQEDEIINSIDVEGREARDFLRTLCKDQYLTRTIIEEKRYYEFKYKIFRKWWKLNKV